MIINKIAMLPNCKSCGQVIKYEDVTRCGKCSGVHHATCAEPNEEASAVWICGSCTAAVQRPDGPEPSALLPVASDECGLGTSESLDISHFNLIMSQFNSLSAAIGDCRSGINNTNKLLAEHSELITSCVAQISDLKHENAELRLQLADMERRLQSVNIGSLYVETRERLRESNIIIFNVPETDQNQLEDDTSVVQKVLRSIVEVSADDIQSVCRVGRRRENSHRPIKVQLKDQKCKFIILKQKNRLRNTRYHNVRVNADMTPKQQEHLRNLRRDLARRRASGERDIAIRFINNEAVIVKLSSAHFAPDTSLPENDLNQYNKRVREESTSPREPNEVKHPNSSAAGRRPNK